MFIIYRFNHALHNTNHRNQKYIPEQYCFLNELRCVKSEISLRTLVFQQLVGCGERLSRTNKFVEPFTARSTCHRSSHVYDSGWQYNLEGWLTLWATRASIWLQSVPYVSVHLSIPVSLFLTPISRLRRRFNVVPPPKRGRTIHRTRRKIKCLARRLTSRWPGGNTRNHL